MFDPNPLLQQLLALAPGAGRLTEAAALILQADPRFATCMIWRRGEGGFTLAADAGEHHEECPIPPGGGVARSATLTGVPLRVGNNKAEERTLECYLFAGSEIAVPLPGAAGALHLQSEQLEAFTEADETALASVAALVAAWLLEETIRIKRVYEPATPEDGLRVLCTRTWPRGIRKESVDAWKPELGTPAELGKPWLAGELPEAEFRAGMLAALGAPAAQAALQELAQHLRAGGTVTLLTSVADMSKTHLPIVRQALADRCYSTIAP